MLLIAFSVMVFIYFIEFLQTFLDFVVDDSTFRFRKNLNLLDNLATHKIGKRKIVFLSYIQLTF